MLMNILFFFLVLPIFVPLANGLTCLKGLKVLSKAQNGTGSFDLLMLDALATKWTNVSGCTLCYTAECQLDGNNKFMVKGCAHDHADIDAACISDAANARWAGWCATDDACNRGDTRADYRNPARGERGDMMLSKETSEGGYSLVVDQDELHQVTWIMCILALLGLGMLLYMVLCVIGWVLAKLGSVGYHHLMLMGLGQENNNDKKLGKINNV